MARARERRFTQILVCITVVVLHYNYLRHGGKCQFDAGSAQVGSSTASSGPGSIPSITDYKQYVPAPCEEIIVSQSEALGWESVGEVNLTKGVNTNPRTCQIWDDPKLTFDCGLDRFAVDLEGYVAAVQQFVPITNVHESIKLGNYSVCSDTRLHESGLGGMFPSGQLSLTSSGYVEPLTPPMRSHQICDNVNQYLMSMDYLVHDFEAMCYKLKPTSKKVLIDMGAALDFFHGKKTQPIVNLLNLYEKFGFHFDHIYAFEIKFAQPQQVFGKFLPEKYLAAYHWINTGVSEKEGDKLNPLHSILKKFDEDDFIVVKLDIDTPSIELPLASQILEGGEDGIYHRLIDQFYFEHHVHIGDFPNWYMGARPEGTVKDTLDLFHALRKKGVPAHFWP